MSEHALFVAISYAVAFVTIGGVAARIIFDYRRLRAELARFGAKGPPDEGQRDEGDAA
ncbi:MAG: heme exporter protein CcmD [Methylocystis sp.]|nr:MAG: heme exporter protein CcmD [Methylocystis sp.]